MYEVNKMERHRSKLIPFIMYFCYNTSCCLRSEQQEVFIMNCCPGKIKREIFIKYICGFTPKELADEFGIHFTTIYRWIEGWKRDLPRHTLKELPLQDIGTILEYTENLKRQLDEVERSLSIIHKSRVLQTVPLKERITMAKKLKETFCNFQP